MLNKVMYLFLFCVLSCSDESIDPSTSNEETINAIYKYDLPADGCDWHFATYDKPETLQFVEDDDSKDLTELLKVEAKKAVGLPNVTVLLTYKLTSKTKEVQCGWNKTTKMQEINIVKVEMK